MANSKPKFIFVKMIGCGHCVTFYQRPSKEESVWGKMLRDPELQRTVEFELIEWGNEKKSDGSVVVHKKPDFLSAINYGPGFYMHRAGNPKDGIEKVPKGPGPFDAMKQWVMSNAPKLSGAKAAPTASSGGAAQQRNIQRNQKVTAPGQGKGQVLNNQGSRKVPPHLQAQLKGLKTAKPQPTQQNARPQQVAQTPVRKVERMPDSSSHSQRGVRKDQRTRLPKRANIQSPESQQVAGNKSVDPRHAMQKEVSQNAPGRTDLNSGIASLGPDRMLGYQGNNPNRFRTLNTQTSPTVERDQLHAAPTSTKKFIARNSRQRK